MWTMVDKKGHEDKDLRVLHVYDKYKGAKSSQPEEPKKKQAVMTQILSRKVSTRTPLMAPYKKITHDRGGERGLTIHYSTNKELQAVIRQHQSLQQEKKIKSLTQELKQAQVRRDEEIDRCRLHVAQMKSIQQEIKLKNDEISKLNESMICRTREEEECKCRHNEEIALLSQEHGRQLIEKKEQIDILKRVADKVSEQKQQLKDQYDRLQTVYNILGKEAKEMSKEVQSLKAEAVTHQDEKEANEVVSVKSFWLFPFLYIQLFH